MKTRRYTLYWRLLILSGNERVWISLIGALVFLPVAASGTAQDSLLSPSARIHHPAVYDSTRKEVLIYGGLSYDPATRKEPAQSDVWGWDGKIWSRIATQRPPDRIQSAMAYDSLRDRVVLFGGVNDTPIHMLNDLWEFDGTR